MASEALSLTTESPMEPPTAPPVEPPMELPSAPAVERRRMLEMWQVMPKRMRRRTDISSDGAGADASSDLTPGAAACSEVAGADVPAVGNASVAAPTETPGAEVGGGDALEDVALAEMMPKIVPWCVEGFPWPKVPLTRWPSDTSLRSETSSDHDDEPADVGGFTPEARMAHWSSADSEALDSPKGMETGTPTKGKGSGLVSSVVEFFTGGKATSPEESVDEDDECPRKKDESRWKVNCARRFRGNEAETFEAESASVSAQIAGSEGLDVVFIIDITGSMGSQIAGVKQMIGRYCEQYGESALSGGVRIHIITYTETSTKGWTSHYTSMTAANLVKYVASLQHSHPPSDPSVSNASGGDCEENLLHALAAMYQEPGGRIRLPLESRVLCFIITDAPPHNKKQINGESKCEREVLQKLGMADDDGSVDMYHVLDRVLDQREGRVVFVPIMYNVQGEALHFYAQAALLTQGMLLRAHSTDSGQLADGLATVVTMIRQLLSGSEIDIPESLGGFEALRIDALVEAASEDDPRQPPPPAAGNVHAALAGLLDSVREIGTRKWGARQAADSDSSEDDVPKEADERESPVVGRAKEWTIGDLGALTSAAACDAAEEAPQQLPAMNVTLSVARLRGVDPSFGGDACTAVCIELLGLGIGESRRPADVVLSIDVSYSMHDVMPQVKETMNQVYTTLLDTDRLAIVTFSRSACEVLPLTLKSEIADWAGIVSGIRAQTATNIEDALRMSLGMLTAACGDEAVREKCLIFLSDGMPNVGRRKAGRLCRLAKRLARGGGVTIHALGFTEEHDITFMSALPRSGSGPQGGYYYLGCSDDILASVGDCLGGLQAKACQDVKIESNLLGDGTATETCLWYGPGEGDSAEAAPLLELQPGSARIASLAVDERQVRILVLPSGAVKATLHLSWCNQGASHKATIQVDGGSHECLELPNCSIPSVFNKLHVVGHVLRLQVASALAVLAGGAADIGDRYDDLHGAVLKSLAALETTPAANEENLIFLEGMLQSLERDLGEALTDRRGAASAEERGVLLSFAQEHFSMHSASSLTRMRATYASRAQVRLRLSFLQSSAAGTGSDMEIKSKVHMEEPGLAEEALACRREAEEHTCFVTLSGWRECVLGVGLFTHPRTLRERRRNLPPEVDLVVDYVSAEAYNLGIRTNVKHAEAEGPPEEDDEAQDSDVRVAADPRSDILTSSARKRINAWLPLYINEANWQTAGTFASSAFSLIATQLNAAFKPSDALKVCARLLCCVVVGFVHPDKDCTQKKDRAKASEAAVQMYCDVHRLFHKMAETYPEIRSTALQEVQDFLTDPEKRTRKGTPDLGNLIAYLSILDEITWDDLAPVFVPEMVRRACTRFKQPLDAMRYDTVDSLIGRFDELEPDHGLVILFNKVFNTEVARPSGPWDVVDDAREEGCDSGAILPCAKVCSMYDERWGQLPQAKKTKVLSELTRIRSLGSVANVFRELLPFGFTNDDACELILWANHNADNKKAIHTLPDLRHMPRSLTVEWKRAAEFRKEMECEVASVLKAVLSESLPVKAGLCDIFEKSKSLEVKLSTPAEKTTYRYSSKEEACAVAAAHREKATKTRAEAEGMEELYSRSAVGYKGKGTVKGTGKGDGKDGKSKAPTPSEWWEQRKLRDTWSEHRDPFTLRIVIGDIKEDGLPDSICLEHLSYKTPSGEPFTGALLKKKIEEATGLDPRLMRLVHKDGILSNSMPLGQHLLHTDGSELRVDKKQRGGKKKAGCGWYTGLPSKRSFASAIAGSIVRDLVFSRVEQFFTRVEDEAALHTLLGLFQILDEDAVVICASNSSRAALRHQMINSRAVETEKGNCLQFGGRRLVLAAELKGSKVPPTTKKSAEFTFNRSRGTYEVVDPEVVENDEAAEPEIERRVRPGEATAADEAAIEVFSADVPDSAVGARVVFVYGSLQESATLAEVLWTMRRGEAADVRVFHLVSNVLSIFVESEEDRHEIDARLTPEGQLREELLLRDQRAPPAAVLMAHEGNGNLPRVLEFQLKMVAMGFVVRLRQRFGCSIPEVHFGALNNFLLQTGSRK